MPDGFSNAALWKSAITHDQPRLCSERPGAIGTEAVDTDGSTSRCREHGLLVGAVGELYQQMESRRDAPKTQAGQVRSERGYQSIAPPPVDLTRPPEVAIKRATLQELCKGELVGDRRATVRLQLRARDVGNEISRYEEPGEAKSW